MVNRGGLDVPSAAVTLRFGAAKPRFTKSHSDFIVTWKTWPSGPGQRQMALAHSFPLRTRGFLLGIIHVRRESVQSMCPGYQSDTVGINREVTQLFLCLWCCIRVKPELTFLAGSNHRIEFNTGNDGKISETHSSICHRCKNQQYEPYRVWVSVTSDVTHISSFVKEIKIYTNVLKDYDHDGDIDGSDLADFAADYDGEVEDLARFAEEFGMVACQ
jgi:hypothetical protein